MFGKFKLGLPCKGSIQQEERYFHRQIGIKFEEETSEMMHLKLSYLWCWNLDNSENISQVPAKFRNVALE